MRQDIKAVVNQIVKKYKTHDPYELCDYMNVLLQIGDLGETLGCYLLIKRQKCILLNKKILRTPLEKVVLSHELGHSKMHWKNDCYFYGSTLFSKSREENEANAFAAELLIPDNLIYENPGMTQSQIAKIAGHDERIMAFKSFR